MSQTAQATQPDTDLVLPVIITKGELARYFNCHVTSLWKNELSPDILKEWGYDYQQDIKPSFKFSWQITEKIFEYYKITPYRWYRIVSPEILG